MKKLLIAFAILFSATLFSCGNSEKNTESVDSVGVVDSTVVDTIAIDTIG